MRIAIASAAVALLFSTPIRGVAVPAWDSLCFQFGCMSRPVAAPDRAPVHIHLFRPRGGIPA